MTSPSSEILQKYADLIVQVGLNLQPGQRLAIQAPLEAAPLVRLIAASAYRAGCRLVEPFFNDELVTLARFENAPRDSFEEYPTWRTPAMLDHIRNGGALLSIMAADPNLLQGQDPKLVGIAQNTALKHSLPISQQIVRNAVNWCIISMPIASWAAKVFPGLTEEQAIQKLWDAILTVTRLKEADPVAIWKKHIRQLAARTQYLNQKRYAALRYLGPGTDLTVGLPDNHIWMGGSNRSENGIEFIPNMPTEEVFTLPHRDQVNGTVASTLPLVYAGNLIENFSLTFREGKIVDYHAEGNQSILKELLETDEGTKSLGEAALVPHSSPIAQSGILFFNTLFDENAASHFAIGKAYRFTMQGGEDMSEEEFQAQGGNYSINHVDFMIGSNKIDVDGILSDGTAEPLMRQGEWSFEV